MTKRFLQLALAALLAFSLAGCSTAPPSSPGSTDTHEKPAWAIYWYLCGSDLESWHGCASADLEEMLAVTLPDNVQVVIQTGGALQWSREDIPSDRIGRYLYDSEGFHMLEDQPQANMGDPSTLASFLEFCSTNYPAEHTMVLFWNHGGGSVTGAEFDANHYFDALTLDEFHTAFSRVFPLDPHNPPIDIIGFDACLMATIDTASTFRDVGRYLVASEELEPGNGWYYTGWAQALADDPSMDAAQLGRTICDAYLDGCKLAETDDDITLSLTDLSKIDALLEAYNALGTQALMKTIDDPLFYTSFCRGAVEAESYGGNTQEQGYTNMVDLGHLVRNNEYLLPESAWDVLKSLDECVIYHVNGPYRSEATGLSCYHSYSGDLDNFVDYSGVGCSEAFKYLYGYGLSGNVSKAGLEYAKAHGGADAQMPGQESRFDLSVLENAEIFVDDMGNAELYVGQPAADAIISAQSILVLFDGDRMLNLGWSDTSSEDFELGLFADVIDGYWPSIDRNLVHTEVVCQADGYTIYSVPVLLNEEQCNLRVIYDETTQEYTVLGARKGLTDEGMADKNLIKLKQGDCLTFLYQQRGLEEDGGFHYALGETITVTAETMFYETPLPPGEYGLMFKLFDAKNTSVLSEVLRFDMDEYYIYFY